MPDSSNILVSVCMITYNHAAYISQAIAGVLAQRCDFAFELVIGVDVCEDDTLPICEKIQAEHPDVIRLLPTGERFGMLGNLNRTLLATRGKYIAFCEGDDFWTNPGKLQMQVDFMEAHPEYVLTSTRFRWADSNNNPLPKTPEHVWRDRNGYMEEIDFFDMIQDNYISTLTVCAVAERLKAVIPKAPSYCFDYWYWLQLSCQGKFRRLTTETAVYRIHPQSVSHIHNFFTRRWPLSIRDALLAYIAEHPMKKVTPEHRKIICGRIWYLLTRSSITASEKMPVVRLLSGNLCRLAIPMLFVIPELVLKWFHITPKH